MTQATKTALKQAADAVKPTSFLHYRDFLAELYHALKKKLDSYSYLQFAEDLGFSKTNVLHLVVQGKRPLSSKAASKVLAALAVKGTQKQYFETLVSYCNARDAGAREESFQRLVSLKNKSLDSPALKSQLEYFSEWVHPVIREMTYMEDFSSDPDWIASRIVPRIRPEQARKSLALLEKLGFIRFDGDKGRHMPIPVQATTGDEVSSMAVVRFHQHMIELGKEAITAIDEDERDIGAVTVCVSEETARQLKKEAQAFRKRLLVLASESKDNTLVYQVNVQLFPLLKKARG